jgi:hypothetical protein
MARNHAPATGPAALALSLSDSSDGKVAPPLTLVDLGTASRTIDAAIQALIGAPAGHSLLLRTTMGSGKSTKVREIVAKSSEPFVLFVPTHALADEYAAGLPGGDVTVRRGVTGLRIVGQPACVQHDRASALVGHGLDPIDLLCPGCPAKDNHPATGGPCPALADAMRFTSGSRVRVQQNMRAGDVLNGLMQQDLDALARPIVIFDEPPPLIRTVSLNTDRGVEALLRGARPSVQAAFGPVVRGVLRGASSSEVASGASLRDLLVLGLGGEPEADQALEHARRTWRFQMGAEAAQVLAEFIKDSGDSAPLRSARYLLDVLHEGVFQPRRPCISREDKTGTVTLASRSPWVRVLGRWLKTGGKAILLDATADPRDLRSMGIAATRQRPAAHVAVLHVVDVHVADAPGVERIFHRWASGPRSRHVVAVRGQNIVKWSELQGVLRHLASLVRARGGPLGILTDKPTAVALEHEWQRYKEDPAAGRGTTFPAEFIDLARSGLELRLGWYGAHRGLNKWRGVAVHATIGDPFPDVAATQAEAVLLGRDHFVLSHWRCQAEVQQASARARPIHEQVTIVHYGSLPPYEPLAPQWAGCKLVDGKKGRPKRTIAGNAPAAADLEEERSKLAISRREHARRLQVPIGTYLGWCGSGGASKRLGPADPKGA